MHAHAEERAPHSAVLEDRADDTAQRGDGDRRAGAADARGVHADRAPDAIIRLTDEADERSAGEAGRQRRIDFDVVIDTGDDAEGGAVRMTDDRNEIADALR